MTPNFRGFLCPRQKKKEVAKRAFDITITQQLCKRIRELEGCVVGEKITETI